MIERLNKHLIIGLDLDKTLVNHHNSPLLHAYIKENPNKKYWIITHRTHQLVQRVWIDIEMYTDLTRRDFEGFKSVPGDLFILADRDQMKRHAGIITGELTDNEKKYFTWKGMIASQLGCTVLVDDLPGINELGTDLYNIELIDTKDL